MFWGWPPIYFLFVQEVAVNLKKKYLGANNNKYERIFNIKNMMQGILYYPIKRLCQCSYTDIVIVAKYEGKRKKDKVKVVEVKWN